MGAPTELVTADGHVAWYTTATLWGRTVATGTESGLDCPLRLPGQYLDDETGLHYNLHRYYDPDTAAYLTPDPLGLAPSPNDHGYVPNPLVLADPFGLNYEEATGGATTGGEPTGPGSVYDRIEATQDPREIGSTVPKSFNLTTSSGDQIWVNPNGTKHIWEETRGLTFSRQVAEEQRLNGLAGAVDAATADGIPAWEQMTVHNNWELIFSPPRSEGLNPVIKHARWLG